MSIELLAAASSSVAPGAAPDAGAPADASAGDGEFGLLLQLLMGMSPTTMLGNIEGGCVQAGVEGKTSETAMDGAFSSLSSLMELASSGEGIGKPLEVLTSLSASGQGMLAKVDAQAVPSASELIAGLKSQLTDAESVQKPVLEQGLLNEQVVDNRSTQQQNSQQSAVDAGKQASTQEDSASIKPATTASEQSQPQNSSQAKTMSTEEFAQLLSRESLRTDDKVQQSLPMAERSSVEAATVSSMRQTVETARVFTAPATMEPPQVAQIARDISAQLSRGNTEMRIALKPEHLGEMRVRIVLESDNVTMSMRVESASVKHVMEANVTQLREALMQQGIKIGSFDVSVQEQAVSQQGQRFEGFYQEARQSGGRERGPANEYSAVQPVSADETDTRRVSSLNVVDYRA